MSIMHNETLNSNVFDSVAKPVRDALAELGFIEPTLPQTMAFPPILAEKNVLLVAPTGSGKTMSYERQSQLKAQFRNTPIHDETLLEGMLEKADIEKVEEIMREVREGKIKVNTLQRSEKPTPLAYHILAKYADVSELTAPERVLLSNIDKMKKATEARTATLFCMSCGKWTDQEKIKTLPEQPECRKCGSKLLALLYPNQDAARLMQILKKRRKAEEIAEEDLKELAQARRKADLILSYGKKAIAALETKGVGPETASRILGKMHPKEDEFYMDLLKAKIQYLRTREYWENKEERAKNLLK